MSKPPECSYCEDVATHDVWWKDNPDWLKTIPYSGLYHIPKAVPVCDFHREFAENQARESASDDGPWLGLDRVSALAPQRDPAGVWVARYYDGSAVYVFSSELEAARYGTRNGGMEVVCVPFGESATHWREGGDS